MDNPDQRHLLCKPPIPAESVTPFGIKAKDRSRHMYVIGKTGMGKVDHARKHGDSGSPKWRRCLAFIDPHGGTADKLLEYVPKERIKDVVYFRTVRPRPTYCVQCHGGRGV